MLQRGFKRARTRVRIQQGFVSGRTPAAALLTLLATLFSGCLGLSNRDDATAPATLKRLARELEAASAVSRTSGESTRLRLRQLFPQAEETASSVLNPDAFSIADASGLDRSLGAIDRPYHAVAQMALRSKAAALCKTEIADEGDQSSMFDLGPVALAGDPASLSTANRYALAAARHVWLDLYSADAPEVQELAALYQKVTGAMGQPELEGKRAVCMAAIIAPQFWLGNPTKTDALRRAALEIGRKIPTMNDLRRFRDGEITMGKYVEELQKDPARGYYRALHAWHEEWLGLRPFLSSTGELRENAFIYGAADTGASELAGQLMSYSIGAGRPADGSLEAHRQYGDTLSGEKCDPSVSQEFDPETDYLVWEHRFRLTGDTRDARWFFVGGWVKADAADAFTDEYLSVIYAPEIAAGATAAGIFSTICTTGSDPVMGGYFSPPAGWYYCRGAMPLTTAEWSEYTTLVADGLTELDGKIAINDSKKAADPDNSYFQDAYNWLNGIRNYYHRSNQHSFRQIGNSYFYLTSLYGVNRPIRSGSRYYYRFGHLRWINWWDWGFREMAADGTRTYASPDPKVQVDGLADPYFNAEDRRFRRFAPTGEQNGYSTVKLWYTRGEVKVCNAVTRHWTSCFYRPSNRNAHVGTDSGSAEWWYAAHRKVHIPSQGYLKDSATSAWTLEQFRCGPPNIAEIEKGNFAGGPADGYPRGSAGFVHDVAFSPTLEMSDSEADDTRFSAAYREEVAAVRQLKEDLTLEPYRLLDHVVSNNRPYSEILTADYSCGHEGLAEFYQSQGYHLPTHPAAPGFMPSAVTGETCGSDANGEPLRVFRLTPENASFSLNLLRTQAGEYPHGSRVYSEIASRQEGLVNPRTMSGVLSMPAMLGPVSPKMRTVASRYFLRLMCGEPNMYDPEEHGTWSRHSPYVEKHEDDGGPSNTPDHFRPECISCHINLDPLAAALSPSFLEHVGNYAEEHQGELIGYAPSGMDQSTGSEILYGLRGGGPLGEGAFLGERVSGTRDVAEVLSESDEFSRCVVHKTFMNVFGRQPGLLDLKLVGDLKKSFKSHQNYNRLVRELAESKEFVREN